MKKILYVLMLSTIVSLAVTSCTEEEVKPTSELNGGGGASDPVK